MRNTSWIACTLPRAGCLFSFVFLPVFLLLTISTPSLCEPTSHQAYAPSYAAQSDRVVGDVNVQKTVSLSGHLPAWVRADRDLGAAPPTLQLDRLTVTLARSPEREQAFKQLLQEQQRSGSPQYHHWLTPEQIGQQFGVTDHDIAAVTGWLQSQGLQVNEVSKSRIFITFSGTASAVGAALSTEFHSYEVADHENAAAGTKRLISIDAEPKIPAALVPVIRGFVGLSQVPVHSYGHGEVKPQSVLPQYSNCDDSGTCEQFVTPADFAAIFDINPVYAAGIKGTGEKIAIIGRSRVANTDIEEFLTNVGLPVQDPKVIIPPDGVDPGATADEDQLEATIDVTRALGTAPGATVDLVISANSATQSGIIIAALYEVDTLLDPIANLSFGACEAQAGETDVDGFDSVASQAAGEGISLFVSSGDAGAAGCDANNSLPPVDQIKSPNYLCSTSYITCVGGTEFNDTANPTQYWTTSTNPAVASALGYIPEGGWNEPTTDSSGAIAYQASASAGGVSSFIAKPSWQTGPGVPADGFRDTPDMAFPSAAHEAYYACYAANGGDCSKGYFEYFYGTSCAAPSMAGVTALIDQKLGGAQGNLNPKLYSVAASTAFHDTTVATSGVSGCSLATPSMCNNSTPSPTSLTGGLAGYEVGTGYDQVTGLGSLDVDKLIVALSPPLPVPTVALTSNPTTITTSQTAVLTAAVSGAGATPTGTVQFSSNGVNLGAAVALTSGTATSPAEPFTTAGTYKITAQYSGDSNYQPATSEVTSLTVTAPGPPPTYTITAPPLIITAPGAITGNTSTITLTAQNGFVGTIAVTCAVAYQGTGTANDPPTCTLSSSGSVALSSTTTSATLTATFATTAPSGAGKVALLQHPANPKQRHPWPTPGEGALLACLVLLPFGLRSKFLRGKAPTLKTAALLFLVCAAGLATGCGGSSNPPPVTNPGTSTGAYTVTLTGTSGSTTITTTVTLTVQ